ncbi:MAG: hypothetical protein KF906_05445 [Actinobacteria bacterium]|nr:hypothetical protein [Actinomycetota bacterium]
MTPRKVWTAAELDEMTPAEVDTLFDESIVDLTDVPESFVTKVRADAEEHIALSESARRG